MLWLIDGGLAKVGFFMGLAGCRFLLGLAGGRFSLCFFTHKISHFLRMTRNKRLARYVS